MVIHETLKTEDLSLGARPAGFEPATYHLLLFTFVMPLFIVGTSSPDEVVKISTRDTIAFAYTEGHKFP